MISLAHLTSKSSWKLYLAVAFDGGHGFESHGSSNADHTKVVAYTSRLEVPHWDCLDCPTPSICAVNLSNRWSTTSSRIYAWVFPCFCIGFVGTRESGLQQWCFHACQLENEFSKNSLDSGKMAHRATRTLWCEFTLRGMVGRYYCGCIFCGRERAASGGGTQESSWSGKASSQ
jgi:hypothetical protein